MPPHEGWAFPWGLHEEFDYEGAVGELAEEIPALPRCTIGLRSLMSEMTSWLGRQIPREEGEIFVLCWDLATRELSETWQGRATRYLGKCWRYAWADSCAGGFEGDAREKDSLVMVVGYVWVLNFGLGDPREYIVGSDGHVSVDSI